MNHIFRKYILLDSLKMQHINTWRVLWNFIYLFLCFYEKQYHLHWEYIVCLFTYPLRYWCIVFIIRRRILLSNLVLLTQDIWRCTTSENICSITVTSFSFQFMIFCLSYPDDIYCWIIFIKIEIGAHESHFHLVYILFYLQRQQHNFLPALFSP